MIFDRTTGGVFVGLAQAEFSHQEPHISPVVMSADATIVGRMGDMELFPREVDNQRAGVAGESDS
tara:strand:- start:637 stop:831 length:195 start_codon:yes stop_codon:yes gene_type:complete